MAVRRYKIYLWVECCLSEYCVYYFLFIMWMKLCKLNQTSDQCEKPNGIKKKTRARLHLGLLVPNVSYFTVDNMNNDCAGFGKRLASIESTLE